MGAMTSRISMDKDMYDMSLEFRPGLISKDEEENKDKVCSACMPDI